MVNLQNPEIPTELQPIEIDAVIQDLQAKLDTNLDWLTHSYGRAYRNIKRKDGKTMYFPEVYIGKEKGKYSYHRVTPDNDKKGTCFFVVGKEQNNFHSHEKNYLKHDIGIVFWVNLKKIDNDLLNTEIFTQHLISQVRKVLTNSTAWYNIVIKEVVTNFSEIYREFSLSEDENYLMAPYAGFRFNCTVEFLENCNTELNRPNAIVQNISQNEILQLLLPTLDFGNDEVFNSLSSEQKQQLQNRFI
ncbi:MAG TPA: hypothetical protein VFM82_12215 [Flavobacteriaceae bacterium]|nr:hypothetical protein [Flavobacteriaceae bacterium]